MNDMECPTCKFQLHPNMTNSFIGKNNRNTSLFIYYQICPECGEPIVGIKESAKGDLYMNPNDIEGLILLTKDRKREK
jgi:uncharacterized protein with PIN domain